MKNLKKVLALALSATMALSMFVSAGAAFTDQADIKTADAVDKLVALNIINGNPDGSFKPDATVTRAEMAKMIYAVRNSGNTNADGYASMTSSFKDINSHWAAGYIKYCQSLNIIAGKSATQFDPDAAVTGTEAAKMLLVCAGYQADKAGLTGSGWDQKTLALASESGLMDDVTSSMTAGLPRQYTAQMISNALDVETVTYDTNASSFVKKETTTLEWKANPNAGSDDGQWVNVAAKETVGQKYMGLSTLKGGIIKSITKEDGKSTYRVETTAGSYTKVAGDYSALMGQKVKVMVKDSKSDSVYGIYADGDSKVIATAAVGAIETVTSDSAKIKIDSTEYKLDSTRADAVKVPVYSFNKDADAVSIEGIMKTKGAAAFSAKLIDNDANGKIDRVVVTPINVGQVTYVGTTSINVKFNDGTGTKTYKHADDSIYESAAKDDWAVVVSEDYSIDEKNTITKATVVTGEVSATKGSDPVQAKVDSTWYKVANSSTVSLTAGSKYDLVVVNGYIYDATETSSGSKDIVFVAATKETSSTTTGESNVTGEAKLMFMDGTSVVAKISKIDGETFTDSTWTTKRTEIEGNLYTYSKNSGGNYEIKTMSAAAGTGVTGEKISKNMAGYGSVVSPATYATKKIGGKSIADDAVVFVKYVSDKETKYKVVTGKSVKDWEGAFGTAKTGMALTKESSGIDYVRVACLISDENIPNASGDLSFGYLVADPYIKNVDGDKVTAYEMWNGTKTETYIVDETDDSTYKGQRLIAYREDGKFITIADGLKTKSFEAAITGYEGVKEGDVVFMAADTNGLTKSYTMDEDCVYIAVNEDKQTGVENGDRASVPTCKYDGEKAVANAYIYADAGVIYAIVYDADSNELDSGVSFAPAK